MSSLCHFTKVYLEKEKEEWQWYELAIGFACQPASLTRDEPTNKSTYFPLLALLSLGQTNPNTHTQPTRPSRRFTVRSQFGLWKSGPFWRENLGLLGWVVGWGCSSVQCGWLLGCWWSCWLCCLKKVWVDQFSPSYLHLSPLHPHLLLGCIFMYNTQERSLFHTGFYNAFNFLRSKSEFLLRSESSNLIQTFVCTRLYIALLPWFSLVVGVVVVSMYCPLTVLSSGLPLFDTHFNLARRKWTEHKHLNNHTTKRKGERERKKEGQSKFTKKCTHAKNWI